MNNQTVYMAISGDNKIKFFNLDELEVLNFISTYNYKIQSNYMKKLENSYEIFDDSIQDYSSEIEHYLLYLSQIDLDEFNLMRKNQFNNRKDM